MPEQKKNINSNADFSDEEKKLLDRRVLEIKSGKVKPVSQSDFHKYLAAKTKKN